MKISIAIPVYNSEHTINILTKSLINTLSEYNLEIVLVNDSSTDNSEKVCIGLFKEYPHIVKFYSLAKNVGEHNAVIAALNHTTGDWVIVMDDDLQNPVSEVKKLIEYALANNYDVVYTYFEKKHHSFFRNLGSKFNDKIANILLGKPKGLYMSSFRAIKKFVVKEIIKYKFPFTFIDGLILRTTSNIGTLLVKHNPRQYGRSQYTFGKLVFLWSNMFMNFSVLPVRLSMLTGIFFIFMSFVAIFDFFTDIFRFFRLLQFYIFFIAGTILFFLGLVGEYIGRIFLSINGQPQYVIRKKFEISVDSDKSVETKIKKAEE